MTDFLLLALARWLHFGAAMILFGSSLFRIYSMAPTPAAGRLQQGAALVALASAFVWVGGSIVSMTDDIASLYDPATLSAYFFDTQFGRVWLICFVILALIVALVFASGRMTSTAKPRFAVLTVASGSLLVAQAWLGHAAAASAIGQWPPVIAYATHVIAAGAWLGGLPVLAELLAAPVETSGVEATLHRFSTMGMVSVALILISGIANTSFRISSLADAMGTAYGQTIAIKFILFILVLILAAQNRFQAMPRLEKQRDAPRGLKILKRNIFIEQVLGAAILLAAAVLGLLSPLG